MNPSKISYHRPKTRGELRDCVLAHTPCEVVTSNVDITMTLLSVLEFYHYSIRFSENRGWTVFEFSETPTTKPIRNSDIGIWSYKTPEGTTEIVPVIWDQRGFTAIKLNNHKQLPIMDCNDITHADWKCIQSVIPTMSEINKLSETF